MLTPNPYSVQPGQCTVHEVPEHFFSVYRAPPTSPPTIVQQAVDPWPSYWRNKQKEKQS